MTASNEMPTGKWVQILIALIFTMTALSMCGCSRKVVERIEVEYRDSVVERVRIDTMKVPVYVEIPAQTAEIITFEDSSHLENDYAVSEVKVDSLGMLHHWLKTKPQKIEQEVEVTTEHTEHETYHSEKEEETVYVQVNVLKWWQKGLMWGGVVLVAAMIVSLIYILYKVYKKIKYPL